MRYFGGWPTFGSDWTPLALRWRVSADTVAFNVLSSNILLSNLPRILRALADGRIYVSEQYATVDEYVQTYNSRFTVANTLLFRSQSSFP